VAFVSREALQHRQRRRLRIRGALQFHASGKRRDTIERSFLREVAANFHIGIHATLQPPEHLENESVAENYRGVALFRRSAPHRQRQLRRTENVLIRLSANALNISAPPAQFAAVLDQRKQFEANFVVENSIVQQSTFFARKNRRDDAFRRRESQFI